MNERNSSSPSGGNSYGFSPSPLKARYEEVSTRRARDLLGDAGHRDRLDISDFMSIKNADDSILREIALAGSLQSERIDKELMKQNEYRREIGNMRIHLQQLRQASQEREKQARKQAEPFAEVQDFRINRDTERTREQIEADQKKREKELYESLYPKSSVSIQRARKSLSRHDDEDSLLDEGATASLARTSKMERAQVMTRDPKSTDIRKVKKTDEDPIKRYTKIKHHIGSDDSNFGSDEKPSASYFKGEETLLKTVSELREENKRVKEKLSDLYRNMTVNEKEFKRRKKSKRSSSQRSRNAQSGMLPSDLPISNEEILERQRKENLYSEFVQRVKEEVRKDILSPGHQKKTKAKEKSLTRNPSTFEKKDLSHKDQIHLKYFGYVPYSDERTYLLYKGCLLYTSPSPRDS
eukprot:TRINITY_DN5702_c0_g2_i2.p1 TRINITY_DN5702_c0_g2~~TRINITY_DN5702_c0_g2_i2.p1  ORF type:complete len:410 (-),score=71.95 TRINITY_DN5702_c0_g2_i2:26-1255(-)